MGHEGPHRIVILARSCQTKDDQRSMLVSHACPVGELNTICCTGKWFSHWCGAQLCVSTFKIGLPTRGGGSASISMKSAHFGVIVLPQCAVVWCHCDILQWHLPTLQPALHPALSLAYSAASPSTNLHACQALYVVNIRFRVPSGTCQPNEDPLLPVLVNDSTQNQCYRF